MTRRESRPFRLGDQFQQDMGSLERKCRGAFYTPESLARWMIDRLFLSMPALSSSTQALAQRICDPAMGTGHFLLAALDRLSWDLCCLWKVEQSLDLISDELWFEARRQVASQCLFGVDQDGKAVEFARSLIRDTCQIEPGAALDQSLTAHFKCADALLTAPADLFPFQFTAVVGNPPYLSHGLRGQGSLSGDLRRRYVELFPQSAEYKISIYALFVELAWGLLGPEGMASFVLPDSFLLGRYFSKLRGQLLDQGRRLHSLTMVRESFWSVTVGRPVILQFAKARRELMEWQFAQTLEHLCAEKSIYRHTLKTATYTKTRRNRFYLLLSEREEQFLGFLQARGRPLREWIKLRSGLISKDGRKNSIVISQQPEKKTNHGCLLERGRELKAFQIGASTAWIKKDPKLYRSGYHPRHYEAPKLLLNQTGYRPKAAVDLTGLYVLNNIHIGIPINQGCPYSNEQMLDFIAAVLNSKVGQVIYEFLTMEGGRAMAQINLDAMANFPMPRELSADLAELSAKCRKITNKALLAPILGSIETLVLAAYGIDERLFEIVSKRVLRPFED